MNKLSSQFSVLSSRKVKENDPEWDIYNTKKGFVRNVNKIMQWNTCEENKQIMIKFLKKTEVEGISVVQRSKYYFSFKTLLSAINKPFGEFTEDDIQEFLLSMRNLSNKSKQTRWYAIKKLFDQIGKGEVFAAFSPRFDRKGSKLPEELLTHEDIEAMIDHSFTVRDKALIAVLYETGARIGEIATRKIKHIQFDRLGAVLIIDGKTGMRRVRIVKSVHLLSAYLSIHPFRNNPDSFLWVNSRNNGHLKYYAISQRLKKIAIRAGIRKRVHPHLFRHSRATHLAKDLTEQQLKMYLGWTGGSKMASIYVHLSGRDIDEAILKLNNKYCEPAQNAGNNVRNTCNRCNTKNVTDAKYCINCGSILDERIAVQKTLSQDADFNNFLQNMYEEWKTRKKN